MLDRPKQGGARAGTGRRLRSCPSARSAGQYVAQLPGARVVPLRVRRVPVQRPAARADEHHPVLAALGDAHRAGRACRRGRPPSRRRRRAPATTTSGNIQRIVLLPILAPLFSEPAVDSNLHPDLLPGRPIWIGIRSRRNRVSAGWRCDLNHHVRRCSGGAVPGLRGRVDRRPARAADAVPGHRRRRDRLGRPRRRCSGSWSSPPRSGSGSCSPGKIASGGGLSAFVEAAVGRRAAVVHGWIWAFAYFLYLPYTVTFVVYDLLPPVFPGLTAYRSLARARRAGRDRRDRARPAAGDARRARPAGGRAARADGRPRRRRVLARGHALRRTSHRERHRPGDAATPRCSSSARASRSTSPPRCAEAAGRCGAASSPPSRSSALAFLADAIPLAGVPDELRNAAVPGAAIAQAYSGRGLAVAVGLAHGRQHAGADHLRVRRARPAASTGCTGRPIRSVLRWIAVPFIVADVISLDRPRPLLRRPAEALARSAVRLTARRLPRVPALPARPPRDRGRCRRLGARRLGPLHADHRHRNQLTLSLPWEPRRRRSASRGRRRRGAPRPSHPP